MRINLLVAVTFLCSSSIVASPGTAHEIPSKESGINVSQPTQSSPIQLDRTSQDEEDFGSIDLDEYVKTHANEKTEQSELSTEEEHKILLLLEDFLDEESQNNDFEKYVTSFRSLSADNAMEILSYSTPSKLVYEKLRKLTELRFSKYRDYVFEKYGFIINSTYSGYHILLLQIEEYEPWIHSLFKEKRITVRYQIIPDKDLPATSNITNVNLVFLNSDRFEISRLFVGDLKEGHTVTGKFEINEKNYAEIRSVKSVTDQDGWDPGFVQFELSADRYR